MELEEVDGKPLIFLPQRRRGSRAAQVGGKPKPEPKPGRGGGKKNIRD